jgi:L-threonylcarbamoyladenylate synthase
MELDRTNPALLDKAAGVIRSGGVVIVLTETFYALAADPFQEDSVRRIFAIKKRPVDKPLPLIAVDRETALRAIAAPGQMAIALMEHFWPGSLTILLQPTVTVSELLAGAGGKIGIRVPPPCPAQKLAELSGGWLTATSANLSGDPNPDEISSIAPVVLDAADLVMDVGPAPGGAPSTVVEPLEDGFRMIREGMVSPQAITDLVTHGLGHKWS